LSCAATGRGGIGVQTVVAGESGKAIIFRANAEFFSGKTAAKTEKKLYLLNEKTEFIPSSEMKGPKSGIFTIMGAVSRVKHF